MPRPLLAPVSADLLAFRFVEFRSEPRRFPDQSIDVSVPEDGTNTLHHIPEGDGPARLYEFLSQLAEIVGSQIGHGPVLPERIDHVRAGGVKTLKGPGADLAVVTSFYLGKSETRSTDRRR